MKLDFISDPGHGWLKVSVALLRKLGIKEKISSYSYMRKEAGDNGMWFAYLEEDCDASLFLSAAKAAGINVQFRERNSAQAYSRVRNYPHYNVERMQ